MHCYTTPVLEQGEGCGESALKSGAKEMHEEARRFYGENGFRRELREDGIWLVKSAKDIGRISLQQGRLEYRFYHPNETRVSLMGKPEYERDELIDLVHKVVHDNIEALYNTVPQIIRSSKDRRIIFYVRGSEVGRVEHDLQEILARIHLPERDIDSILKESEKAYQKTAILMKSWILNSPLDNLSCQFLSELAE
jgi:hypothetical protein